MIQKLKPITVLFAVALAFSCGCTSSARAEIRLPALFSDNAVLQQGMRVPIWGWADEGEEVTVSFRGQQAKAEIEGNKVVVSNPAIPQPVAVRYGWADYPVVNLWNKDGLPASPFRTDNFPMITQPKK